jgi:hypothetical protein
MSEHVSLSFLFNNAGDVVVEFPDEKLCISLPATFVGTNLYRLDAVPYPSEIAGYADIVEAVPAEAGRLRFVRVVQRSGWSTHSFILAREAIEGEAVQAVLRAVLESGGYWEAIFGGCLFICLPPGSTFDPERALGLREYTVSDRI